MILLSISEEKCRQCYRCIQGCPTNALKIDNRKVLRIENRCVFCGTCYRNCPHDAIIVHTGVNQVLELLQTGEKVVACLDPSFPAVLDKGIPGQLVTSLKKLGFQEVWESASGGDLVIQEYKKYLTSKKDISHISSFCPSLVLYIEKFAPNLVDQLVPVVSPMIATGMSVKQIMGADTKVVFVSSCISRIWERIDKRSKGIVDYILTYHDIAKILKMRGIDREKQDLSDFSGPQASDGRFLSIAGGMTQCLGFDMNLLNLDFVIATGPAGVMRAIQQLQDRTIKAKFLDLLFCKGCINGPSVDRNISGPSRKQIVVNYIKSQHKKDRSNQRSKPNQLSKINLKRVFFARDVSLPERNEAEIQAVLKKLHKTYPNHNLDCGSCGYNTCRDKAIAVVQGLAEIEMCPHYLMEQLRGIYSRLEKSHKQLKNSHIKLEHAQKHLFQTEKMASLGQLAAGVAHELNNPLGTITLFGQILKKELSHNKKWEKDINLIVQEAERAAKIVKDLLSFSRETKIKPGLVNLNSLIEEALSLVIKQSLFHNIDIQKDLDSRIPITFADADFLKQAFLNIILNGAQAMDGYGTLIIRSKVAQNGKEIQIQIEDSGIGIPKEKLPRLFDPFFTTKKKGTGLGLALAYGIVSKHKGSIKVESKVGEGATFIINLPVLDQQEWIKGKSRLLM